MLLDILNHKRFMLYFALYAFIVLVFRMVNFASSDLTHEFIDFLVLGLPFVLLALLTYKVFHDVTTKYQNFTNYKFFIEYLFIFLLLTIFGFNLEHIIDNNLYLSIIIPVFLVLLILILSYPGTVYYSGLSKDDLNAIISCLLILIIGAFSFISYFLLPMFSVTQTVGKLNLSMLELIFSDSYTLTFYIPVIIGFIQLLMSIFAYFTLYYPKLNSKSMMLGIIHLVIALLYFISLPLIALENVRPGIIEFELGYGAILSGSMMILIGFSLIIRSPHVWNKKVRGEFHQEVSKSIALMRL